MLDILEEVLVVLVVLGEVREAEEALHGRQLACVIVSGNSIDKSLCAYSFLGMMGSSGGLQTVVMLDASSEELISLAAASAASVI